MNLSSMVKCTWAHKQEYKGGLLIGNGKERKWTLQMCYLNRSSNSQRMTMPRYRDAAMKKMYMVVVIRKY